MSRDAPLPPTRAAVLDEIVRAAAGAFGALGYRTATLEAIAERAGLSKVTLYRYVGSKEELLSLVVERIIDEFQRGLRRLIAERRPANETLRRIVHYQVELLAEHLPFLTVFFSEESGLPAPMAARATRAKREYDQAIERVVREGVEAGLLRDLPPRLVVFGLLGMCNWLHKWYRPDGKRSAGEIADVFVALLERGYLAEPTSTREDGDALARIDRRLARLEETLGARRPPRPRARKPGR
jgi:TetR/AcrR family transcriptional regulator, cholesterol catabolism regulator